MSTTPLPVFIHGSEPLTNGKFVKTNLITYVTGDKFGPKQQWEAIEFPDSVHILVNNTETEELLLVKQVRIPVLVNNPDTTGEVIECAAGIIDGYHEHNPEMQAKLIAVDEIKQELGYSVTDEHLRALPPFLSSVGMSGNTCHPFFCEVTNAHFTGQELQANEDIEVVRIAYEDVYEFLRTVQNTDATTRMLVQWFMLENL